MSIEVNLFPDGPCYVRGDPETAGFYEIQLPDGFRWAKRDAGCQYRVSGETTFASPSLLVRAMPRSRVPYTHLVISIDDQPIGVELIEAYGTYYFPLRQDMLSNLAEGSALNLRLLTIGETVAPVDDDRDLGLAIYEVRVIDQAASDFPERHEFLQQAKLFQPEGGEVAQILSAARFSANDRVLDLGCGTGWTTAMLASLGPATVWGIDVYDYAGCGRRNFKTELVSRLRRHTDAVRDVPAIAALAQGDALEDAVGRCSFVSMNAEEMLWRDNLFDFVFSLNAFEHIARPDRALAEIRRILRPGGRALIQFSPLYYADCGSHLPMTVGLNRPWAHLLMTPEEVKRAVVAQGGVPNEVDSILGSLNRWSSSQFRNLFETSGLNILSHRTHNGFTIEGAGTSAEFTTLLERFPREELTTVGMIYYLERPRA